MRLRAALVAVALLGLGGTHTPGHAQDTAPALAVSPPADSAAAPDEQTTDQAQSDTRDATDAQAWQTVGEGVASWYGSELAGHRTASGERFDPDELTAAHRSLPLGSKVRVTFHGRSVVVRINDRGPFAAHRLIDLSRAAAERIGLRRAGSGEVTLAVLDSGDSANP